MTSVPVDARELTRLQQAAAGTIGLVFQIGRHEIASALLADDGRIFTGINLKAVIGRASVCAEATALGTALIAGARTFRAAAVFIGTPDGRDGLRLRLVPPCGPCRELIADYAPAVRLYIDDIGGATAIAISDLLPHKYTQD
jgi:cytidine deaminase